MDHTEHARAIAARCAAALADRWAATGLVGLAEEVHKVAGMLTGGRARAAAANRAILALQLPSLIAATACTTSARTTCGTP
ncbi:hypothetical protein GCM10027447_30550 [Glycomyces halotolerans]